MVVTYRIFLQGGASFLVTPGIRNGDFPIYVAEKLGAAGNVERAYEVYADLLIDLRQIAAITSEREHS